MQFTGDHDVPALTFALSNKILRQLLLLSSLLLLNTKMHYCAMIYYVLSESHKFIACFHSLLHLASRGAPGCDSHELSPEHLQSPVGSVPEPSAQASGSNRKFLTFIRCCIRLLLACSSKHKNFLEKNSNLLGETISQMILHVEEQLFLEGDSGSRRKKNLETLK